MDSQILPNAVEYLLTPLSRLSSPDQFIPAAALAWLRETSTPWKRKEDKKETGKFPDSYDKIKTDHG